MPRLGAAEVPIAAAATVAARSLFEGLGAAALSQCAAEAIGAAMAIAATAIGVSVRQRSVLLRSGPPQRVLITRGQPADTILTLRATNAHAPVIEPCPRDSLSRGLLLDAKKAARTKPLPAEYIGRAALAYALATS